MGGGFDGFGFGAAFDAVAHGWMLGRERGVAVCGCW